MKIVKYFYGKPLFTETLISLTDEHGNYVDDTCYVVKRKAHPRGTVCGIYDTDTKELNIGISRCSNKDVFVKSVGKELARNRAETKPIMKLNVMDKETISHVFFDQAKLLDKRYSTVNFVKF